MSPKFTPAKKIKWPWVNFLLALASLFFFGTITEGLLAVLGVRPLSLTEDPYVGFAKGQPLFVLRKGSDGIERYETNPVKLSHFNFQTFPAEKAPGTYRIFCLGGSTTYGHPYRDPTSYSGWLREMLAEGDSTRHFEVINCGGISYASYREAQLVDELTRYQPDLFVIYSGHNEFLEERTYRTTRELSGWIRETSALLDRTRTYSVMRRALAKAAPPSQSPEPKPGKTVLAAEESNVLERTIGPTSYTRNDSLRQQVLDHFELSLRRIANLSHAAGAQTLFLSTPSSERDCSPFKSESSPGISSDQKERAAGLLKEARQLLEDSGATGTTSARSALEKLDVAVKLDPRNAEILYHAGRAAFALKRFPEAKSHFRRALDEDICPLRALTPMRDIERRVAEETGSLFLDFVDTMEQKTRREFGHDILGEPDFLDHVHLNVEGYGILARGILQELERGGAAHLVSGFNGGGLERVQAKVLARLTPAEEGLGLHNVAKVLNWAGKKEDAARIALRGLAKDSTGLESIWSSLFVGASLERHGNSADALPHYRRALRLDSNNSETRRILGEALLRLGDSSEAVLQLESATSLDPGSLEIHQNLADLQFFRKHYREASEHLRILVAASPANMNAAGMLAASLVETGQFDEAESRFQNLVKVNPSDANAWFGLGYIAEHRGRIPEAIQLYGRSSQLAPNFAGPQKALSRLMGNMR